MLLKQFYLNCLAHASYLVGDEQTGIAAVVDPQRDVDQYVAFAEENGLRIRHVFLTHFHADFVAGHLELRDRFGATIYLGAAAKAEFAFTPLKDGDRVEFGTVRLRALETPGHTAESICLLVFDRTRSDTVPQAVLTGDTLFVGDVGRPDLRVALGWSATELGGMLYESLRSKLLTLPDDILVYPAHGAGSLCGKALSKETVSTIGEQRKSNYALQPMTKEQFIKLVTADQPDAPPYFTYDAVLNSREHATLDETLERELKPLTLDEVLTHQAAGAQVLDTREPEEFASAHLAGSINIGLGGRYATWAGTILRPDRPIVIIASPGREEEAALRLGRIGFENVIGFLKGGLKSLDARPELVRDTDRLNPDVAAARLASPKPPVLVDVRAPGERAAGYIQGSLAIPLNHLVDRLGEVPRDRPVLIYCAGGYRSSIAASLFQMHGFPDVSEISGGMAAWEAAGLPGVGPESPGANRF
ncbi:MAG TPA: MBL fold metallo-hydrolase [Vicinamibacterales bacterium]|nr:MBL fold metallo-hydrolase [Vicinamibacterales bacterium]